jgi:hypothetical protein
MVTSVLIVLGILVAVAIILVSGFIVYAALLRIAQERRRG